MPLATCHNVPPHLQRQAWLTQSFTAPGVPQAPGSPSGLNVPNFLHFVALAARVLILLPLLPILLKPATTYSALQRPPPSPTHDTLLLPGAALQPAYGTFTSDALETSMRPGSSPATKAPEGYDIEPGHEVLPTEEAPLLTRSRKSSSSSDSSKKSRGGHKSKDFEPIVVTALTDEPEAMRDSSNRNATENYPTDALNIDSAAAVATALEISANEEAASDKPSEEAGSSSKPPQSTDPHVPISFPTADDASSIRGSIRGSVRGSIRGSIRSLRGGINFGKDAEQRSEDAETTSTKEKRKGSASQNFQRLARRVSLVPKRQPSTSSSVSGTQKKDGGTGSGFLNMMKIRREESNASEASSSSSPLPAGNSEEAKQEKKKKRMSFKI